MTVCAVLFEIRYATYEKKSNDLIVTFVYIPETMKNTQLTCLYSIYPKVLQYKIFDMIRGPIMPQKRIGLIQNRQSLI